MARVFRLGEFFGITASQLVLFKPEHFSDLLEYHYNSQASESLYSLTIELEYLKKALTSVAMKPNYNVLKDDFKMLGYLGLDDESSDGKATMKIAAFYKDAVKMDIKELEVKYGSQAGEILNVINESLCIDVPAVMPGIDDRAIPIVEMLYSNMDYLREIQEKCRVAYEGSYVHENKVSGKPIREVIELDKGSTDDNKNCCRFVNQMYSNVKIARTPIAMELALSELGHDINNIQNEYDAKDIEFTDVSYITQTLSSVYSVMSVDALNELLSVDGNTVKYSEEDYDAMFRCLDGYGVGGLGFNTEEMGNSLVDVLRHDDKIGVKVQQREHNDKLDALLAIAYADLKSRQFMSSK